MALNSSVAKAKGILVSLTVGTLLALPCTSSLADTAALAETRTGTRIEDEKLLRQQANDYAKAFAAGNYKAIADMWAPEGTFTNAEGRELQGRVAIQQFFAAYFERFGAQPLDVRVESIRFPSDGVAIEEGQTSTHEVQGSGNVSQYTVVHVKENGRWQMEAVTERDCSRQFADSLKDLDWLIGTWTAKCSPAESLHLRAEWVANHNFIRCTYGKPGGGDDNSEAITIIGRNPINGRIISWHFDPKGGSGSGKWFRDGQSWVERAMSVEPSGATGGATYVLRKLDDNTFTWRSTNRSFAGSALPDRQELTLSRDVSSSK
jgi:uncharacterized protein (TIGR02246 family)